MSADDWTDEERRERLVRDAAVAYAVDVPKVIDRALALGRRIERRVQGDELQRSRHAVTNLEAALHHSEFVRAELEDERAELVAMLERVTEALSCHAGVDDREDLASVEDARALMERLRGAGA